MLEHEKKELFQQKALDKLKNPHQELQPFVIVRPIGWLAVLAVLLVVFSASVWAFFGVMADKVVGYGLILDDGGVDKIVSSVSGRVLSSAYEKGDFITAGQVLAEIEQPDLQDNLLQYREELNSVRSTIDMELKAAQINTFKEQLHRKSHIVSPYDGEIISKQVADGDYISYGSVLYVVRHNGNNKHAVIYVPALAGAKIKPGMTLQVAPGSVDSSTYGSLVGNVVYVSPYPIALGDIEERTGSSDLAQWLMAQAGGSALEVYVELIKDSSTASGYLWTSLSGPPEEKKIADGMLCTGTAIVERNAPFVRAFYKFRQWIRSD